MEVVKERQEFILPTRIVKAGGEVLRKEKLLQARSLALLSTFKEEETACFQKTGEEDVDFSRTGKPSSKGGMMFSSIGRAWVNPTLSQAL